MRDLDRVARAGKGETAPIRRIRVGELQAGLNRAGLAGLAVLACGCVILPTEGVWGWTLPVLLFLSLYLLVAALMRRHYPHPRFGPANSVTLIRAAMACSLLAPLVSGAATGWAVALIAGAALILDGVDGWLARRSGLASDFGARFDMEVDALLALLLAVHAYLGTAAGAEVLALGLMRYVFVAAALPWPFLAQPLPPRWRRKAICVVQLAALIVLQLPGLPADAAITLTRLALALVLWSFAVDVLWLRAHQRPSG